VTPGVLDIFTIPSKVGGVNPFPDFFSRKLGGSASLPAPLPGSSFDGGMLDLGSGCWLLCARLVFLRWDAISTSAIFVGNFGVSPMGADSPPLRL